MEGGPPCFPQDFACPVVLRHTAHRHVWSLRLRDSHPLGCGFPATSPDPDPTAHSRCPTTPTPVARRRFGLFPVRSPLLRESRVDVSSSGYMRCFSSPGAPRAQLSIHWPVRALTSRAGCPIRNRTAQRLDAAPRPRFAGLRVLRRHVAPRHPPCTASSLAITCSAQHVGIALLPSVSVLG